MAPLIHSLKDVVACFFCLSVSTSDDAGYNDV